MSDVLDRLDLRGYGIADWMQASKRVPDAWAQTVEAELDQPTRRMDLSEAGLGLISLPQAAPVSGMVLPVDTGSLKPSMPIKIEKMSIPLGPVPVREKLRSAPPVSRLDALEL